MSEKKLTPSVRDFLYRVARDNAKHVSEIDVARHDAATSVHKPLATVVTCSDSRVQKSAFDRDSSHDLFMVRNIGNQLITCEGSVEYGVLNLKTPILLIVGHSQCGAVNACISGFEDAPLHVKQELSTMRISGALSINAGVLLNVHHQVDVGRAKFAKLIEHNELIIIGAIYDFRNDFSDGHGRFILINVNGERNKDKIEQILGEGDYPMIMDDDR